MAQHLCIVSRDNPLLLGYLNIALEYLTRTGDELEIVIDRRPDSGFEPAPGPVVGIEQRQLAGVDTLLRSRGYAIVSRDAGESWRLSNTTIPLTEEDELAFAGPSPAARAAALGEPLRRGLAQAAGIVGDGLREGLALAANAFPEPVRRRLAVAAGAACIVIGAATVAIKSDAVDRVTGAAGDAVAWLRSAPAADPSAAPAPAPPPAPTVAAPAPAPAPPPVASSEPSRVAEVAPSPVSRDGRNGRASESPGPARLAKLASPPTHTNPAPAQPGGHAVGRAPAPPAAKPTAKAEPRPEPKHETKAEAKIEPKPEPRREVTAAAVTEAPAEFSGVPRLEMRRERDATGHTAAIAVRVTDAGGRSLPTADVRILRRLNGGGIQETRLTPDPRDGSFRGALPRSTAESDGLSMRVTVGRVSHEVPIAE
jgi:hypothetical protein